MFRQSPRLLMLMQRPCCIINQGNLTVKSPTQFDFAGLEFRLLPLVNKCNVVRYKIE